MRLFYFLNTILRRHFHMHALVLGLVLFHWTHSAHAQLRIPQTPSADIDLLSGKILKPPLHARSKPYRTAASHIEQNVMESVRSMTTAKNDDVVYLCVLAPADEFWMFSQKRILPAIEVAANKVDAMEILPNTELKIVVGDSRCNARDGPIRAFEYYYIRKQLSVFLGPVCDYSLAPIARYAPVWALPVISPGGFAHDLASKRGPNPEYPTLTRLGVTFNGLSNSVLGIITEHFRWKKVKVIYEPLAMSYIIPRFCYLAAAALVNVTKEMGGLEHDFFIYLPEKRRAKMKEQEEAGDGGGEAKHRRYGGRNGEKTYENFGDLLVTEVGDLYSSKF